MALEPTNTIGEAQKYLKENMKQGTVCPCCDQVVKRYDRRLRGSMIWALDRRLRGSMIWALALMFKYFTAHPREEWLHVENYLKTLDIPSTIRGDFPKLEFWGLIERKRETRADGSPRTGFWRITIKGIEFLQGKIKLPASVYLYNNHVLGFSDELVNVEIAAENQFNYAELLDPQYFKNKEKPFELKADSEGIKVYEHKGSIPGDKYVVQSNRNVWSCSCEAFKFSRDHNCKHIINIKKAVSEYNRQAAQDQQTKLL